MLFTELKKLYPLSRYLIFNNVRGHRQSIFIFISGLFPLRSTQAPTHPPQPSQRTSSQNPTYTENLVSKGCGGWLGGYHCSNGPFFSPPIEVLHVFRVSLSFLFKEIYTRLLPHPTLIILQASVSFISKTINMFSYFFYYYTFL